VLLMTASSAPHHGHGWNDMDPAACMFGRSASAPISRYGYGVRDVVVVVHPVASPKPLFFVSTRCLRLVAMSTSSSGNESSTKGRTLTRPPDDLASQNQTLIVQELWALGHRRCRLASNLKRDCQTHTCAKRSVARVQTNMLNGHVPTILQIIQAWWHNLG